MCESRHAYVPFIWDIVALDDLFVAARDISSKTEEKDIPCHRDDALFDNARTNLWDTV